MRHSTNQFNINDAVQSLPTLEEYLNSTLFANLETEPVSILSY